MTRSAAKDNATQTAFAYLRSRPQWLVWRLETVPGRPKPTKPPYSAKTLRKCSATDPANWVSYEEAKAVAERHGFDGVGFALSPDDGLTGIDLDHCRDPKTGEIAEWARRILELAETYCEVSPSGSGLRLFAKGKVRSATKDAGIEIYGDKRYLTFTGNRVPGAPDEIRAAPFTVHALHRRIESLRPKQTKQDNRAEAKPSGEPKNFFRRVNDLAMKNLDAWVPEAFPTAVFHPGTGAYRISSADLNRDLEEDLSIAPEGIIDFGVADMGDPREGKRTPIDVIMIYPEDLIEGKGEGEVSVIDAALWLCERLDVDPPDLGWKEREQENLSDVFGDDLGAKDAKAKKGASPPVRLTRASEITPERINWFWTDYLAAGKMHLLAGPSTAGKTTLALALTAVLTTGGKWPDGSTCAEAGDVLIWSGEDGIADTIVPRLLAAGADASRVHIIQGVMDGKKERAFDPSEDMAALSVALDAPELRGKVRLLIIDSLASAVAGDAHRNNEVRRGLQPVVDLAERHGVAILGIVHFSKGTQGRNVMERINGSLAFGALARIVLVCAVEEADDGSKRCLFLRGPCNIGASRGGWEYEIAVAEVPGHSDISNTVARFGAALTGSAQSILNEAEGLGEEGGGKELAKATAFLRGFLEKGEVELAEVKAAASAQMIAERTLRRAKGELGVIAEQRGARRWVWRLENAKEAFAAADADGGPF